MFFRQRTITVGNDYVNSRFMVNPRGSMLKVDSERSVKVVTIVGARPQFIKAAVVTRAIRAQNMMVAKDAQEGRTINEVIVHTGQHFDANMSEVFFKEMQIPTPDYNLNINSMNHGAMTGRMLEKIEEVLLDEKPDYVMVYGDTNSTLAGALAAKKLHIKVVHIESGLRSYNMRMPEEINRILTDRISDILCCPTDTAIENLEKEGFAVNKCCPLVVKTGDVMQDAALYYSSISSQNSSIIKDMKLINKDFVLCTVHRAENTDDPNRLRNIFEALQKIGESMQVVVPLHPRTKKILSSIDLRLPNHSEKLLIIKPVGYFDMIELLRNSKIVMTDSGGLQKEAFFFSKPCVTLRDETEWRELIDLKVNIIAGSDKNAILAAYNAMHNAVIKTDVNVYGNGQAAYNIIKNIK